MVRLDTHQVCLRSEYTSKTVVAHTKTVCPLCLFFNRMSYQTGNERTRQRKVPQQHIHPTDKIARTAPTIKDRPTDPDGSNNHRLGLYATGHSATQRNCGYNDRESVFWSSTC
jgi:hypothetical protein